jgi:predicted nucleic acid-binding protein
VILVDTDVLLDVAFRREPHVAASRELLGLLERRGRMAFVAWHTLVNFFHLARPVSRRENAVAFLRELTTFALVAPGDTETFRFAASLEMPDLEDAMQVAAAWSCGARFIATRNTKDFRRSPIPARTPEQLLKELA